MRVFCTAHTSLSWFVITFSNEPPVEPMMMSQPQLKTRSPECAVEYTSNRSPNPMPTCPQVVREKAGKGTEWKPRRVCEHPVCQALSQRQPLSSPPSRPCRQPPSRTSSQGLSVLLADQKRRTTPHLINQNGYYG